MISSALTLAGPCLALIFSIANNSDVDPKDRALGNEDYLAIETLQVAEDKKEKEGTLSVHKILIVKGNNNSFNIYTRSGFLENYELVKTTTGAANTVSTAIEFLNSDSPSYKHIRLFFELSLPLQTDTLTPEVVERKSYNVIKREIEPEIGHESLLETALNDINKNGYNPPDLIINKWSWGKKAVYAAVGLNLAGVFLFACTKLRIRRAQKSLVNLGEPPTHIANNESPKL